MLGPLPNSGTCVDREMVWVPMAGTYMLASPSDRSLYTIRLTMEFVKETEGSAQRGSELESDFRAPNTFYMGSTNWTVWFIKKQNKNSRGHKISSRKVGVGLGGVADKYDQNTNLF